MNFAVRRRFQPCERVKQRALSGAGRAAEKDSFTATDGEIHAAKDFEGCFPKAEGFFEPAGTQVDFGHGIREWRTPDALEVRRWGRAPVASNRDAAE